METLSPKEVAALFWSVLSVAVFAILMGRLVAARLPGLSVGRFLVSGPLIFLHPARYVRSEHKRLPWWSLLLWALWIVFSTAMYSKSLSAISDAAAF